MRRQTTEKPVIEHSELIDMRTHLTVALLAAAQLEHRRKTRQETERLECYLHDALASLVEDVGRVDVLLAGMDEREAAAKEARHVHLPKPLRWARSVVMHAIHARCIRAEYRRHTRLTTLTVCR